MVLAIVQSFKAAPDAFFILREVLVAK